MLRYRLEYQQSGNRLLRRRQLLEPEAMHQAQPLRHKQVRQLRMLAVMSLQLVQLRQPLRLPLNECSLISSMFDRHYADALIRGTSD
jgi:hypothetical protein